MRELLLAWTEARGQMRSAPFLVLTTLCVLLVSAATLAGVRAASVARGEVAALQADRAAAIAGLRAGLSGQVVEPTLRAIRTPNALAALVRGFDDGLPLFWDFGPWGPVAGAAGGPSLNAGGTVDWAFSVRVILGLLAMALALDSVVVEREAGVAEALQSLPIHHRTIVAAKLLGSALSLATASVLAAVPALLILNAATPLSGAAILASLGVETVLAWTYLMAIFGLGAAVAAAARNSGAATVFAVVVWLAAAVAAGPFVDLLAGVRAGVPAEQSVERERDQRYRTELDAAQRRLGDLFMTMVSGPPSSWSAAGDAPAVIASLDRQWSIDAPRVRSAVDAVDAGVANAREMHDRLVRTLSVFNPALQFDAAASEAAGTGRGATDDWRQAILVHAHVLDRQLFDAPPRIIAHVSRGGGVYWAYGFTRAPALVPSDLPAFRPPSLGLRQRVSRALPAAAVLMAEALGLVLLAAVLLARRLRADVTPGLLHARQAR